MGRRLASEGYSVLIPNPFYRASQAPIPAPDFDYSDPLQRTEARKLVAELFMGDNPEKDTKVFLEFLQSQFEVDNEKRMGTNGYCMGGTLAIRSAAGFPDIVGAAASFHGGGLVTEKDNSPHLLIPRIKANVLIAIASNDDEREPETKDILERTFQREEVIADIQVYEDAFHGWCVTDSSVYNQSKAEVAWKKLLQLYEKSLV
jgi:carboxymethylenebutenolidase